MNHSGNSRHLTQLLLIALPLLLVGGMATRGVLQEFSALETQREELGEAFLAQLEEKLIRAVTSEANIALGEARLSLKDEAINAPRRLILKAEKIVFLAAFSGAVRMFPPEETTAIQIKERRFIDDLSVPLRFLRKQLDQQPFSMQWVPQEFGTALVCRRFPDELDLCVLMHPTFLDEILHRVVQEQLTNSPQWEVVLQKNGVPDVDKSYPFEVSLTEPLKEWHLLGRAGAGAGDNAVSKVGVLLSIVLPLLVSWLALSFYFKRQRMLALEDSERRSLLTAQLSHELRTPITNLTLYIDLLKRKASNSAEVERYAGVIAEEVERMGTLSHQAIAVARGQPLLSGPSHISVDDVIRALIDRFQHFFDRSSCEVVFHAGVGTAINIDQVALESIVLQLLENACKYASPGRVEVGSCLDDGQLIVSVRDYGDGVPDALSDKIFEANIRGGPLEGIQGFGLGLATARYLASMHDGDLRVENLNPGAKFTMTLGVKSAV